MLNDSKGKWIREYLWRGSNFSQMDFQFTFSQMVNLCQCPSEVYRSTLLRKEIKNQWARDDPAFVAVLIYFIMVACLAYTITFGVSGGFHFLRLVFGSVVIEFMLGGIIIASTLRWIANKYMRQRRVMSNEQCVEWLYAFDVHCNSFFPFFLLLYPGQYFLSPFLMQHDFVAGLFSNTLYCFASCVYIYITFLGYNALPFLSHTERFLYPIGAVAALYVLLILTKSNACRFILDMYFG